MTQRFWTLISTYLVSVDGITSSTLWLGLLLIPASHYRICPGQHLADANFWISMATTLAAFNITKSKDAEGREITPSGEYNGSMVP